MDAISFVLGGLAGFGAATAIEFTRMGLAARAMTRMLQKPGPPPAGQPPVIGPASTAAAPSASGRRDLLGWCAGSGAAYYGAVDDGTGTCPRCNRRLELYEVEGHWRLISHEVVAGWGEGED